jgi:hypothetical protein
MNNSLRDSKVDLLSTQNIDFHGRRITNAGEAKSQSDYVTLGGLASYVVKFVKQSISDLGSLLTGDSLTTVNKLVKVGPSNGQVKLSAISEDGTTIKTNGIKFLSGPSGTTTGLAYSNILAAATAVQLALVKTTTAPADTAAIAGIDCYSHDGVTAEQIAGTITFRANGLWTGSNHGTDIAFRGISTGSTTLTEWARFSASHFGIGVTPTHRLHSYKGGDWQFKVQNPDAGGGYWVMGQTDNAFGSGGGMLAFVPDSTSSANRTFALYNNGDVQFVKSTAALGFFGSTPAAKQTLSAYTTSNRSAAFVSTPGALGTAATLADLNTLRASYEVLRLAYDDLRTKLQTTTLVG